MKTTIIAITLYSTNLLASGAFNAENGFDRVWNAFRSIIDMALKYFFS